MAALRRQAQETEDGLKARLKETEEGRTRLFRLLRTEEENSPPELRDTPVTPSGPPKAGTVLDMGSLERDGKGIAFAVIVADGKGGMKAQGEDGKRVDFNDGDMVVRQVGSDTGNSEIRYQVNSQGVVIGEEQKVVPPLPTPPMPSTQKHQKGK
jgi:hypothetical protein